MKSLALVFVMMFVVLFVFIPTIGFSANEDPLFCSCVDTNDDSGDGLTHVETFCADRAIQDGYARWRLRAPQKGEALPAFVAPACNASVNGVLVCQGGPEELSEPLVCAGSPSME